MVAGDELRVCRATLAAVAACAIARQRTPMLRKARVPFGEVLREAWRERRRRKRIIARLAVIKKTRNARIDTTTWRAKMALTAAGDDVRDIWRCEICDLVQVKVVNKYETIIGRDLLRQVLYLNTWRTVQHRLGMYHRLCRSWQGFLGKAELTSSFIIACSQAC